MSDRPDSWRTLSILLEMAGSGRMIPEMELHFSPEGRGQGTLAWSFIGLMPPSLSDQERLAGRSRIRLPWATLATPLAGKFDALVLATDEDPILGESVVARIAKLTGSGEIALTGLPRTGQLRLRLIRREAPRITAETEPLVCNTLPVLLDSALPQGPRTAQPVGWRLLCDPCPLNDAGQWQVTGSIAAAEGAAQVALLLLDDSHQVCAMADLSGEERRRIFGDAVPASGRISRNQFSSEPARPGTKTALRVSGVPRWLAIGVSTLPPADGRSGSSNTQSPSRITVQECPAASPPSRLSGSPGRLEILRSWQLPFSAGSAGYTLENNPSIRPSPLRAAWYDNGELTLIHLEKEETAPRTLKLEIPPGAILQGIYWTGPRIHLHFQARTVGDDSRVTSLLYSFDPETGTPPVKPYDFGKPVEIHSLDFPGIPETLTLGTGGRLFGILNAEGRILILEPSPEGENRPFPGIPQYAISPTRIGFHAENEGPYPVLDWTDGTLRLQRVPKAETPLPQKSRSSSLQLEQEGILADWSTDPPAYWRSPMRFTSAQPLGDDRAIGLTSGPDGTGRSIVLMRKVPAKP